MNPFKQLRFFLENHPEQFYEAVRENSSIVLSKEIKFVLYKIIVKNLFLYCKHFYRFETLVSPLSTPDHECDRRCLKDMKHRLATRRRPEGPSLTTRPSNVSRGAKREEAKPLQPNPRVQVYHHPPSSQP